MEQMMMQHNTSDAPSIKLYPGIFEGLERTYSGLTTRGEWSGDAARPHGLSAKQHQEVRGRGSG